MLSYQRFDLKKADTISEHSFSFIPLQTSVLGWSREGEKRVDLQLTVNNIQMLGSKKADVTDQPSSYDEEGNVTF